MDKYYNIAGFLIRVTGEEAEAIQCVSGFEPFEVKFGKPYFTFYLTHEVNKELLAEKEFSLLYTIDYENFNGRFVRLVNGGYRLTMMSSEEDELLLLNYRPGYRECFLAGLMKPDLIQFALWTVFGILTAGQAIVVRASVILFEGKAVVFMSESNADKSAHVNSWLKHIPASTLLIDDGFIILRDSSIVCGSPWSRKIHSFHNKCLPLAGIIRLSQASHNKIHRLWMLEAIGAILPFCSSMFGEDKALSRQICDTISEVLNAVPVWQLECQGDEEAVKLSSTTVFPQIKHNRDAV